MGDEVTKGCGLTFRLNEEGSRLQAVYCPDGPVTSVDFAWIKHALDAQRAATGFFILEHAAGELKKQYNEATAPFIIDIGEKRDARFSISLAADRMSATLNLSPPYAGIPIGINRILENLKSMQIISGILNEKIAEAISSGKEIENLIIAEGRPAQNGYDAQLLTLIPTPATAAETDPAEDEDTDSVEGDYNIRQSIPTVKAGTPLMRRIPPTSGVHGEDVTGAQLTAEDGVDLLFAENLPGAMIDPDDPDLLLAEIGGMPVPVENGICIEPLIKVKNIDLASGNLYFDGSVQVTGDVREGMELKAAGDVTVDGIVEAATINCGGTVAVTGGVIGHITGVEHGEHIPEHAVIRADGNVSALFVENAVIESGADIAIKELAMKSELTASGSIKIGEDGSRKGHLIGGVCRAGKTVRAIIAGSGAAVATRIEAGSDPMAGEKLNEVQQLIAAKGIELEEIDKDRSYCRDHPNRFDAERARQLENSYEELQSSLAELFGRKKRLQRLLAPDPDACISVEREIYYGVTVKIGDQSLMVDDDLFNGTFTVIEGQLSFTPNP